MIRTKKKGLLIVISGPSGSGKGSVIEKVLEKNDNLWLSISCTSRSPRGSEVDGVEYYFIKREEFEEKIRNGEMLEYAKYADNYYGTPRKYIKEQLDNGKDVILEIEIQGALKVQELLPETLFIFILPPSMDELKRRLRSRNTESAEVAEKRFKTAYQEINELSKYNYVVVNDTIEKAADKINAIIMAERCRVDRIEEVYLNTSEEEVHEGIIDKNLVNEDMKI